MSPNRYKNPAGQTSPALVARFPVGAQVFHLEGEPFTGQVIGHWGTRIVDVRVDPGFAVDAIDVGVDFTFLELVEVSHVG